METTELSVADKIQLAKDTAMSHVDAMDMSQHTISNGSEAWQAVVIKTKGNIKLQNQLKKLGMEKDYYWGYTISAPVGMNNYWKEEVYTENLSKYLNEFGIESYRVERLL